MRWPWIENGYLQIPTGNGFYMGIPLSIVIPVLAIVIVGMTAAVLALAVSSRQRSQNR